MRAYTVPVRTPENLAALVTISATADYRPFDLTGATVVLEIWGTRSDDTLMYSASEADPVITVGEQVIIDIPTETAVYEDLEPGYKYRYGVTIKHPTWEFVVQGTWQILQGYGPVPEQANDFAVSLTDATVAINGGTAGPQGETGPPGLPGGESFYDYEILTTSTVSPVPYKQTLVDSSGGEVLVTLPAVNAGDERWYSFCLQENSNHCNITSAGGCLIGGLQTISLSTEKATVALKADGVDCYEIMSDTRSYDRPVEVTGNLSLPSGFESGAVYYGEPPDGGSAVITIADFDPSHIGDYAKFVKKTGENATFRVVSEDQTFDEVINQNNKGFTISVSPTGYIITQDSRPTASNVRITMYPTDNISVFEPTYAGVLETALPPEETLTSVPITSSDQSSPTSLGFWINDNKALIGDLAETSITASAVIKETSSFNRSVKIRFRYYEYDFVTNTLNTTPLSTTSYSSTILESTVFQELLVSGMLPANTWAANDGSVNKLLVIELQAYKSAAGGNNPTIDFKSGGENTSSTYLSAPFANVNHNTLGGVVPAGIGIPDGHVDSNYPLQLPSMTTTRRDEVTPVAGMMIFNTTTNNFERFNGSAWEVF